MRCFYKTIHYKSQMQTAKADCVIEVVVVRRCFIVLSPWVMITAAHLCPKKCH